MCEHPEQWTRCAVTSSTLDAVVEGPWKVMNSGDALARAAVRPTGQPERGGCPCMTPMDTIHVPVSVPVGVARLGTARASASQSPMPDNSPSTTDGGPTVDSRTATDSYTTLGLQGSQYGPLITNINQ